MNLWGVEMNNETKAKLKAYFASKFFVYADINGPDYSDETAGDLEGLSLEAIQKAIDEFDEDKIA